MIQGNISISKEELSKLDAAQYGGIICVVETAEQLDEALNHLRNVKIVGFDTETRPSFKKGHINNVSLIQLATPKITFLIRLHKTGFTESLVKFIEGDEVKKIGLSIKDDFHNLNRISPVSPGNFVDLQNFVKEFSIIDNSLSKIYGVLFGKRICKGQRLTNWEADPLTLPQQQYAALDAAACLEIYSFLKNEGFNPLESPYYKEVPEDIEEEKEN